MTYCYRDTRIYNGSPTSPEDARNMGISWLGCPYRGTTVCLDCYFTPAALCTWKCARLINGTRRKALVECRYRSECRCGHDQTARLKAWGLI